MNELQLSLLGLGAIAILMVIVYNRWVERKHLKLTSPVAEEVVVEEIDQSLTEGRQEPIWEHGTEVTVINDLSSNNQSLIEPLAALTEAESWIDAIATLRFYETRTAGSIRETITQMGLERFERIEFYSGDGWHKAETLPSEAVVSNLRSRLQLASRRGPVSSDTLHSWMRSLESLAQMLSAGLSVESENSLIDRATNLDAFCARVDALINISLKPSGSINASCDKLMSEATTFNLIGEYPNYVRLSGEGEVDFQVHIDPDNLSICLTLDFPHVQRPDSVVIEMLDLARQLSTHLEAAIVDDSGLPLSEDGMALLANQVIRLNAMLQAQGIEPGSVLARRLFA